MKKRNLRNIILGGQDGLVNVLGIILAMAGATQNVKLVIIAGLAATFAESLSMAGVGYTSAKAALDYYLAKFREEEEEVDKVPEEAKAEIKGIYERKGFKGSLLNQIVDQIISKKKIWIETMMGEEHGLYPNDYQHPVKDALVIGWASVVGSLAPLVPFFFVKDIVFGMIVSFIVSMVILFLTGVIKAKVTLGGWFRSGLEITAVGMGAAILGYLIGLLLGMI